MPKFATYLAAIAAVVVFVITILASVSVGNSAPSVYADGFGWGIAVPVASTEH
jgi:hypothetical protein